MNRKNLKKIAAEIRKRPRRFNLNYWFYDRRYRNNGYSGEPDLSTFDPTTLIEGSCGTTACVAGWATVLFAAEHPRKYKQIVAKHDGDTHDVTIECGQEYLGLTDEEARALFTPDSDGSKIWGRDPYSVKGAKAATILEKLADGKIQFPEHVGRGWW